jgi:hypothetical protein
MLHITRKPGRMITQGHNGDLTRRPCRLGARVGVSVIAVERTHIIRLCVCGVPRARQDHHIVARRPFGVIWESLTVSRLGATRIYA